MTNWSLSTIRKRLGCLPPFANTATLNYQDVSFLYTKINATYPAPSTSGKFFVTQRQKEESDSRAFHVHPTASHTVASSTGFRSSSHFWGALTEVCRTSTIHSSLKVLISNSLLRQKSSNKSLWRVERYGFYTFLYMTKVSVQGQNAVLKLLQTVISLIALIEEFLQMLEETPNFSQVHIY